MSLLEHSGYAYRFEPGSDPLSALLVSFHGTGGDEFQLADLIRQLDAHAPQLAPRGQEMEAGLYRRYFKRLAEGVLDEADLAMRAGELAQWLRGVVETHGLADRRRVAVGYSNGASISAGILLLHPEAWDGVVLLRPMVPLTPDPLPNLEGKRVLILASPSDAITPIQGAVELREILESAGAQVQFEMVPGGHSLTQRDLEIAQAFIRSFR